MLFHGMRHTHTVHSQTNFQIQRWRGTSFVVLKRKHFPAVKLQFSPWCLTFLHYYSFFRISALLSALVRTHPETAVWKLNNCQQICTWQEQGLHTAFVKWTGEAAIVSEWNNNSSSQWLYYNSTSDYLHYFESPHTRWFSVFQFLINGPDMLLV